MNHHLTNIVKNHPVARQIAGRLHFDSIMERIKSNRNPAAKPASRAKKKGYDPSKPYVFKNLKTVSAGEILAAGGITAWIEKTGYDSSKIRMGGTLDLTDAEFEEALRMLKRSK